MNQPKFDQLTGNVADRAVIEGFSANSGVISINMSSTPSGTNGGLTLASIDFNSPSNSSNLSIRNSSTSPGFLQLLNGSTINGVSNTLLAVRGSSNLTIENGTGPMSLQLGTSGVFQVASGSTLTVNSSITQPAATSSSFSLQGGGTTILNGANTYTGTTTVNDGTLRVNGTNSGGGSFSVGSDGTHVGLLGGTGTLTGATTVNSGGTLRGGFGTDTGTLTVGDTTIKAGGNLLANLNLTSGGTATNSKLNVGGNKLNFETNSILNLSKNSFSYSVSGPKADFILATLTNGDNLLVGGTPTTAQDQVLGTYYHAATPVRTGPVYIDASSMGFQEGDRLVLHRQGNDLVLTFSPVPEPASLLAVCGLAAGGFALARRLRRKPTTPDHTTPA